MYLWMERTQDNPATEHVANKEQHCTEKEAQHIGCSSCKCDQQYLEKEDGESCEQF